MMFPPVSPLETANLREIDPIRDPEYSPLKRFVWNAILFPYNLIVRIICTAKMALNVTNAIAWHKPYPLELIDRISGWLSISPESNFISDFPSALGQYKIVRDPRAVKALFKHFRGSDDSDGILGPSRSMEWIFAIIKDVFPNSRITKEDSLFNCSQQNSTGYRSWLHTLLNRTSIEGYKTIIREEASNMLKSWSQLKTLPLKKIGVFPSQIITRLMLGRNLGGVKLAEAVNFISWYALHNQIRRVSAEHTQQYQASLQIFRECVNEVIDQPNVPIFSNQGQISLSLQQKQAMAFIMFFAGQETTGFLLGEVLSKLARKPDLQGMIREELTKNPAAGENEIWRLIHWSLSKYPPVAGVARRLKKDVCLEYRVKDGPSRKLFMQAGTMIAGSIIKSAEHIKLQTPIDDRKGDNDKRYRKRAYDIWSVFGGSAHYCPGKDLALTEVVEFVKLAISGYEITTDIDRPPHVECRITMQHEDPATLSFTPINFHEDNV